MKQAEKLPEFELGTWDGFTCSNLNNMEDCPEEESTKSAIDPIKDPGEVLEDNFQEDQTFPLTELPPELFILVLRKLDVFNLKKFRFVCKAWKDEICKILQGRVMVDCAKPLYGAKFDEFVQFPTYREYRHSPACYLFTPYDPYSDADPVPGVLDEIIALRSVSESQRSPSILHDLMLLVCCYHVVLEVDHRLAFHPELVPGIKQIKACSTDSVITKDEFLRLLTNIISKCKDTLTHLDVLPDFLNGVDQVDGSFPNLKCLRINQIWLDNWVEGLPLLTLLEKVIRKAPSLVSLGLNIGDVSPNLPSGTRIPEFRFQQIQNLEIDMGSIACTSMKVTHPERLPRLKSLKLNDDHGLELDQKIICDFLCLFASTLEFLSICIRAFEPHRCGENFPVLSKLQVLHIMDFKFNPVESSWLKKTPLLNDLRVCQIIFVNLDGTPGQYFVFPELIALTVCDIDVIGDSMNRAVEVMWKTFPNLRLWRFHENVDTTFLNTWTSGVAYELHCHWDDWNLKASMKGLERLILYGIPKGSDVTMDQEARKLMNNELLPDLKDVVFKSCCLVPELDGSMLIKD